MQNQWFSYVDTRSRSQVKVIEFTLEFHVHFIFSLPLEGYSLNLGQMLISARQFAEPMTQLCRLLSQGQVRGHGTYHLIFVSAPYLLYPWNEFSLNFSQKFILVR